MNLPKRVKVGGFWYSIGADNDLLQAEGLMGEILVTGLTIRIDDSKPPPVMKTTLLHELIHASLPYFGDGDGLNEGQIKVVSRMLFQVLTENPEVRKFIFEDEYDA